MQRSKHENINITEETGIPGDPGSRLSESEQWVRGRGKDTLFRITIRNQADHISIADNKANIIISINTIIISLVVALLGTGATIRIWPFLEYTQITPPLIILLVSCTISAVFSLLAAKPRIRKGIPDLKRNSLLFFGNFSHMTVEEYLEEMDEVLSSNENIYRSLILDLYNYGRILNRKYRLLAISYTAFLTGLVCCVAIFLILFAIHYPYE